MPSQTGLRLIACALAFTLALGASARAQDDDDGDDSSGAPVVVDINGSCTLTVEGNVIPCRGVAYMVFPSNHRIDFTGITDTAGWAFSGMDDDNRDGRYTLDLDSVLNPASGRLEAEGRCEMVVGDDRRTVKSLDCRATTPEGEFSLKASGMIAADEGDDDGGDD